MSTSRDFLSPAETQQIRAAAAEEIHNAPPATPAQRGLAETVMAPAVRQSLAARRTAA